VLTDQPAFSNNPDSFLRSKFTLTSEFRFLFGGTPDVAWKSHVIAVHLDESEE